MSNIDEISKMKVAELRAELSARGLDSKGVKAVLFERLKDAIEAEQTSEDVPEDEPIDKEAAEAEANNESEGKK